MLPSMVADNSTSGIGSQLTYPNQWPMNVGHHAIPSNQVHIQGDMLQSLNNGFILNPINSGNIRQQQSQMQIPVVCGQPASHSPAPQNVNGFFPPSLASGYSFMYPAILAALAAQTNALNSRSARFCVQPGSVQTSPIRGPFHLANPTSQAVPIRNVGMNQQVGFHTPFQYIHTPNGIQFATFTGGVNNSPHGTAVCSFPHSSVMGHGSQLAPVAAVQFRSYDSLKHFGALPQLQNNKRNKSMTTSKTNLYISGLSEFDTDETVRALVEDIIHPKSCKAMLLNGKCKGSGFIDCATEEDALSALNHLSEMAKNGGRKLNVKYALENEKDLLNVYVRNLPRTGFTKETLENLFRPYGQVTSVKLLETDGAYTGIGFVRFASAEQAQSAVDSMNEARYVLLDSPGKPICCKLADKADPKRRASSLVSSQSNSTRPLKNEASFDDSQHLHQHVPGVIFHPDILGNDSILQIPTICRPGNLNYDRIPASIPSVFHHGSNENDLFVDAPSVQYSSSISFSSFPPTPSPIREMEPISTPITVNTPDLDAQNSTTTPLTENIPSDFSYDSLSQQNLPSSNSANSKFSQVHDNVPSDRLSHQNSDRVFYKPLSPISKSSESIETITADQDTSSFVSEFQNLNVCPKIRPPPIHSKLSSHLAPITCDSISEAAVYHEMSIDSRISTISISTSEEHEPGFPIKDTIDEESLVSNIKHAVRHPVFVQQKIRSPLSTNIADESAEDQFADFYIKRQPSRKSNHLSISHKRPISSGNLTRSNANLEVKAIHHRSYAKPVGSRGKLSTANRSGSMSHDSSGHANCTTNCSGASVSSSL